MNISIGIGSIFFQYILEIAAVIPIFTGKIIGKNILSM